MENVDILWFNAIYNLLKNHLTSHMAVIQAFLPMWQCVQASVFALDILLSIIFLSCFKLINIHVIAKKFFTVCEAKC